MPFRIAIIGAGYMAEEHLKVFSAIPDVELSGICSRTFHRAESLAQKFKISVVCDSIAALYESSRADLVIIAVPELQLLSVLKQAARHPWKMLVEKPLGYNFENALEIVNLINSLNADIYIALNRRHYSSTRYALNKIQNDTGTRVVHVIDQENLIEARNSGQPNKVIENWMFANSVHLIDYFSIFCRGIVLKIENLKSSFEGSSYFISSIIEFESGDLGIYNGIWDAPGPWHVTITTAGTRYEFRPLENLSIQTFPSRELQIIPKSVEDTLFKPGLAVQSEQAILMLRGLPHSLPSLAESIKTMTIIEGIYGG